MPDAKRKYSAQIRPRGVGYMRHCTDDDLVTARLLVQRFERQADGDRNGAPIWHGWGIHQAFCLGILWERRRVAKESLNGKPITLAPDPAGPGDGLDAPGPDAGSQPGISVPRAR